MSEHVQLRGPAEMTGTTSGTVTTTSSIPTREDQTEPSTIINLQRPTKKQERKKVIWTEDTVDNENMNKKKSKCCCIYEKPRKFDDDSDSEDSDDECEVCLKHVEKKHKKHKNGVDNTDASTSGASTVLEPPPAVEKPPDNIEPSKEVAT